MNQDRRAQLDAAWDNILGDLRVGHSLIHLIDSLPGLLVMTQGISEEARYIAVSKGWTKLVGWSQDEIKKLGLVDLSVPEDLTQLEGFEETLRSGAWKGIRYRWRRKYGGAILFEWQGTQYVHGFILCGAKVIEVQDP